MNENDFYYRNLSILTHRIPGKSYGTEHNFIDLITSWTTHRQNKWREKKKKKKKKKNNKQHNDQNKW